MVLKQSKQGVNLDYMFRLTERQHFEVPLLTHGNWRMSGLPGTEDRLRDGKDEWPELCVFWISENGRVTHANSFSFLFTFVHASSDDASLHLSLPLSGKPKKTPIYQHLSQLLVLFILNSMHYSFFFGVCAELDILLSRKHHQSDHKGVLTSSILRVRHVPLTCILKRFLIPNNSPLWSP